MKRKTSAAQLNAGHRYDKANTKSFCLKLNINTDGDILAWLSEQESMQGSIKRLIRDELRRRRDDKGVSDVGPTSQR
ncbi:MAG: hypothetical protein IJ781_05945 [Atopobiaceae bacterium]|nr:hypothetical protein [Atopobiaceae bacterium]